MRGAEFNPDADTVVEWLDQVLEERDPVVAFPPKGVKPLCEDLAAAVVIGSLPVMDERGLAQLPSPPPPGGGDGRAQAPGGGSAAGARGGMPKSSRGGVKRARAISPITMDSSSGRASSAAALPSAGGRVPVSKWQAIFSPSWQQVRPLSTRCVPVLHFTSWSASSRATL